jgi:hypothetical protein
MSLQVINGHFTVQQIASAIWKTGSSNKVLTSEIKQQ